MTPEERFDARIAQSYAAKSAMSLSINGKLVDLPYHVVKGERSYRIDSMKIPGKEFEQLWYRGRNLTTVSIRLDSYTDDQDESLESFIELISPSLSDTGLLTRSPNILTIAYPPITRRKMRKFVVARDDSFRQISPPGQPVHSWFTFDLIQWAAWMGPGIPVFVDANPAFAVFQTQTPGTSAPVGPSVATTSSIVDTDLTTGQGGSGQNPGTPFGINPFQ